MREQVRKCQKELSWLLIITAPLWTVQFSTPQFKKEDHSNSKWELAKLSEDGMKELDSSQKDKKLYSYAHQSMLTEKEELAVLSLQTPPLNLK